MIESRTTAHSPDRLAALTLGTKSLPQIARGSAIVLPSISAAADTRYEPAARPTLYFIGVTTGQSAIMKVFPQWAKFLKLGDVAIQGIDCKCHAQDAVYRRAVEFIKRDPLSKGALVTSHKINLLSASHDLFENLDAHAQLTGEICCISKRDGRLCGFAKDLITSGLALEAFLPDGHWQQTGAEALILGAGGSAIAIATYLMDRRHAANRPRRILISGRNTNRAKTIADIHRKLNRPLPLEYHPGTGPRDNDALMRQLPPRSLVINATGLGKDTPGSPITHAGRFPDRGYAWDFNYRGELVFLEQAAAQGSKRQLWTEDGWTYFIHGWTRVIAEVFNLDLPVSGPRFDEISRIARAARNRA